MAWKFFPAAPAPGLGVSKALSSVIPRPMPRCFLNSRREVSSIYLFIDTSVAQVFPALQLLWLNNNQLSGTIPENWNLPASLGVSANHADLQHLL